MKVVVVIPGYNEERYLGNVLKKVLTIHKHVLYVDDGSLDKSFFIAQKYLRHCLRHSVNLGKGAALKTGARYAFSKMKADAVIFMDADDQHNPHEIPKFIRLLKNGALVVFGVRKFSQAMPILRLLGNRFASIFFNLLYQEYIPDIPSGYKAITKKAFQKVEWNAVSYEVEMEIAVRTVKEHLTYNVLEIDTIYHDADKGMTALDAIHIALRLIQWKFVM